MNELIDLNSMMSSHPGNIYADYITLLKDITGRRTIYPIETFEKMRLNCMIWSKCVEIRKIGLDPAILTMIEKIATLALRNR